MHEYGAAVPAILNLDLKPDDAWCWFLMPDMGATDYDAISLETTLQTARCLGRLQRNAVNDKRLPRLMPQCLPSRYLDISQALGVWIEASFPGTSSEIVEIACSPPARKRFFDNLVNTLAALAPTCVHGDLWSGNIAVHERNICLLDWSDAVWGMGTSSIVNFLLSSDEMLPAQAVWDAYAQGWQHAISSDLIRASQAAHVMTSLVIERELARFQPAQAPVPVGILPLLEKLVALSD